MYVTFSVTASEREPGDTGSNRVDSLPVDTSVLDAWRAQIEGGGWLTAPAQAGAELEVLERSLAAADPSFPDAHRTAGEAVAAGLGLAVSDPRTGCSGVTVVGLGRADVVLSGTDEVALRSAVEDLLNVMTANGRSSPSESAEWDAGGRLRARGRVRVLSTTGLYGYAARHGAPLVLWVITLALALVSVLIAAAVGENSSQGWLADWAHATLDRVFTGALGAALVATVMAGRQLQRGSGRRRRHVLVRWTDPEGAPR
ncbi:MAG: hypothetical protein PIR02_01615 [Microbacterium enclense]